MEGDKMKNKCSIKLNPKIYPLEVIYSAAYVLLDKAFISFDGDPEKEVIVNIKPRESQNPDQIADEFQNELVNYLEYRVNYQRNKDIRDMILQRAILTNDPGANQQTSSPEESGEMNFDDNEEFLDDELGIAVPWEEKQEESKEEDPLEIAKEWQDEE